MSQNEIERIEAGAPDFKRKLAEQEQQIRQEVGSAFPEMSPEAQEAIIQSRLKILINPGRPSLIKVDLGESASKKAKDDLFE
ncbi:MAG: hypothetical protein ACXWRE_07400 [Pseudobdellovibrionaceae bacterium]